MSFSDRVASITRIQSAQLSNRASGGTEAQKEAKRLEGEAYKLANSTTDYHARVRQVVRKAELVPLEGQALQDAEYDSDVDQLLPGGITICQYTDAHHHKDGLFSAVYKAKAPASIHFPTSARRTDRVAAVKVTNPSAVTPPHDSKREARLLQKAKCDFVISLLESFVKCGGRFVLTFPYMPYDLEQLLRRGRLSERQGKDCLRDVFSGLAHIHEIGIIHRDIKPSNILLRSPSGPAFIADFGIAWLEGDSASEAPSEKILDVGTTCYRPPELMFGNQQYGSSLDLWAAGCVVAQVVSLGSKTLFDSGDLGSDLALIKSIFETLGTPDLTRWPEAAGFPDWGKMTFHDYPGKPWTETLTSASSDAQDLVANLVRYESRERLTAHEALSIAYLS